MYVFVVVFVVVVVVGCWVCFAVILIELLNDAHLFMCNKNRFGEPSAFVASQLGPQRVCYILRLSLNRMLTPSCATKPFARILLHLFAPLASAHCVTSRNQVAATTTSNYKCHCDIYVSLHNDIDAIF